ncbi:MAG: hypothetical protein HKM24_03865 [Gammaproteobacteria bacterium]|nr:hypothetical protein [Gammaproteobacteria bacterium]
MTAKTRLSLLALDENIQYVVNVCTSATQHSAPLFRLDVQRTLRKLANKTPVLTAFAIDDYIAAVMHDIGYMISELGGPAIRPIRTNFCTIKDEFIAEKIINSGRHGREMLSLRVSIELIVPMRSIAAATRDNALAEQMRACAVEVVKLRRLLAGDVRDPHVAEAIRQHYLPEVSGA